MGRRIAGLILASGLLAAPTAAHADVSMTNSPFDYASASSGAVCDDATHRVVYGARGSDS